MSSSSSALDALPGPQERVYALSRRYLGGQRFSRSQLASRSDVHAAIVKGVPFDALMHLLKQLSVITPEDVAKVLDISTRTLSRHGQRLRETMQVSLASKAWSLAEVLAKATEIFGGLEQAERWLSRPAMGLDRQRPIDLLQTDQGRELVDDFLGRLEYGVYT